MQLKCNLVGFRCFRVQKLLKTKLDVKTGLKIMFKFYIPLNMDENETEIAAVATTAFLSVCSHILGEKNAGKEKFG